MYLEIKNLTKTISKATILKNISLAMEQGKITDSYLVNADSKFVKEETKWEKSI